VWLKLEFGGRQPLCIVSLTLVVGTSTATRLIYLCVSKSVVISQLTTF
jgi:hypothetical protein